MKQVLLLWYEPFIQTEIGCKSELANVDGLRQPDVNGAIIAVLMSFLFLWTTHI